MDEVTQWLSDRHIEWSVVLATASILVAAPFCILLLKRLTRRAVRVIQGRLRIGYETTLLVTRLITGAGWFIIALMLLHVWGISVGGIWTLLISAATLIGVGFLATWTMISNLTASLFITFWRPFQFGETVEILPESLKGRVVERNMMFTVLREDSGGLLQIPNNFFFQRMFRVTGGQEKFWFENLREVDDSRARMAGPTPHSG